MMWKYSAGNEPKTNTRISAGLLAIGLARLSIPFAADAVDPSRAEGFAQSVPSDLAASFADVPPERFR